MILLDGHSLEHAGWIGDVNENLIKKERDCTAAWTPQALGDIGQDSWLLDETKPGEGIVWRIQNMRQMFSTDTPTVNLEHVINILKDRIIFGEVGPAQITGTTGATTCTAQQAIQYILSYQNDWTLGDFDYASVTNPYKFDGETLYEAIEKVSDTLEDAWWSFDTTVYPFELNITQKQTGVGTELRANRNMITIDKTIDRGPMYTRFYPVGKDDLHITGNFVQKNSGIYGIKEKEEVDQSLTTEAELIAWANERLNKHAEPVVSVVVDGLELCDATGEELDRIKLGRFCQIPLPEYSTTITERIVELNYPDAKNSPEVVRITMANNREDVTKILADAIRSGGKSRRTSAKQNKEDHAWFEDTNNHVAMCAEGIVGVDSQGNPNWTRLSQIIVDENGIDATVQSIQNDNVLAWTAIHQNENAITLEAQRAADAETNLTGQISVEAGKINQVVTAVGADGQVTAASICIAINESGDSNATINADKIYLLGQTIANTITANYIATKISSIASMLAQDITAQNIDASTVKIRPVAGMGAVSVATGYNGSSLTLNGNTYTLRLAKFNGDYDEYSFSRATTLSAGWDGNRKFTVSATPQGNSRSTTLWSAVPAANVTWDGTTATLALNAAIDDDETTYNAGNVTVNIASFLEAKTGTAKITQNGTFTPGTGFVGFSQIEVDVTGGGGGTTTIGTSWSNGILTITASPQGVTETRVLQQNAATWSGNTVTIPIESKWGSSQQYSEGVVYSATADVSAKITSAGYAGRAAVGLADPTWNAVSGATPTNRTATVTTTGRTNSSGTTDNLSKSISLYLTQGSWSSNKLTVFMRTGSTSGTVYAQTEVNASTLVTNAGYAGRAAVSLNDPTWNAVSGSTPTSRTVTVSTSGRTDSSGTTSNLSKSVGLYLTQGSWSSNKLTVFMRAGGTSGTVYAQTEVNASTLVTNANYAGRAAVNLGDPRWNTYSGNMPASRVVYVDTTGRTDSSGTTSNLTKAVGLYLTEGSWGGTNNSVKTVYMREGSTGGTTRAQITIDATSRYSNGWNANRNAWLDYGALTDYQGPLSEGSFVKTVTSDINGNSVNNSRGGYWFVPSAWFLYRDTAGSNHQGDLQGGKYIELVYTRPNNGTPKSTGSTWYVPPAGPSYSHSASLYCYEITTGSTGVKTCRFSVQYSASQSVPFSSGHSYSMHW